jgi:hypothetical protein
MLGELASLGSLPSVAFVVRLVVRDILDYKWKREVLRHTPNDQMARVIRELGTGQREVRK